MPFINVKMTPGPSAEKKAELISEITQLVVDETVAARKKCGI